jgi:hypothetical protein
MRPALPASEYYGGSAPPRPDRSTTNPTRPTPQAAARAGQDRDGSRVHLLIVDGGGTRLCLCGIAAATPQHFTPASLPAQETVQEFPTQPSQGKAGARRTRPSARFHSRYAIKKRYTTVPRVCLSISLARPAPSGSTDTPRLCQGRLPPSPVPPRSGCPQLRSPCCDRETVQVSHLHSTNKRLTAHS